MEEKIKEVQEYFKNKMLKGEFVLGERIESNYYDIVIDKKYSFSIWINNFTQAPTINVWDSCSKNFMKGIVFTEQQQAHFYELSKPMLQNYHDMAGRKQKFSKVNQLLAELGKEPITE